MFKSTKNAFMAKQMYARFTNFSCIESTLCCCCLPKMPE
jgi:hypothetical protein